MVNTLNESRIQLCGKTQSKIYQIGKAIKQDGVCNIGEA